MWKIIQIVLWDTRRSSHALDSTKPFGEVGGVSKAIIITLNPGQIPLEFAIKRSGICNNGTVYCIMFQMKRTETAFGGGPGGLLAEILMKVDS